MAETSGFDMRLLIYIVNGYELGPTLAIIAGIHLFEFPGIEGTIRLANELNPNSLEAL